MQAKGSSFMAETIRKSLWISLCLPDGGAFGLQGPQDLSLDGRIEGVDLIQKNGASIGLLQDPFGVYGACVCPFF